ncbi:MAG TPA: extensin family protein [Sphingomicrobium sp.]
MTDIRISTLAKIDLLYDRSAPGHYGVTGIPFKPFINPAFRDQCDTCFEELAEMLATHAGLKVKAILSGGVSRAGQGTSLHHKNRAFDFDGLIFDGGAANWVATSFPVRPQLYLGMEAVLRRHFGTVLTFDYNKAHEDHFHFDNGTAVGFKQAAKSHVIFIQNVIALIHGERIGRDGVWGGETDGALKALRTRLKIGPVSDVGNWKALLTEIAKAGMSADKALR